jgi:tetratricopeptide (TPR) repeat protein
MEESADATNLACLRFMSAWVCINEGEMQKCVDQCELIDEIYAPILTIKGQAQISLGHIEEAILTLVDACKHSPQEILAWFQLAKAYHITNRPEASWNALLKCENLAPQSAEVSLFMGIVALEMEQSDKVLHAYECLSSHQSYLIKNASLNLTLIKLSLKIGDPAQIKEIIAIPDWDAIVDQPEFFREIPGILRDLEELDQMNIARDLLIIPHTFANSRPLIQSA